jgi:hypothetical protein
MYSQSRRSTVSEKLLYRTAQKDREEREYRNGGFENTSFVVFSIRATLVIQPVESHEFDLGFCCLH